MIWSPAREKFHYLSTHSMYFSIYLPPLIPPNPRPEKQRLFQATIGRQAATFRQRCVFSAPDTLASDERATSGSRGIQFLFLYNFLRTAFQSAQYGFMGFRRCHFA